MFGDEGGKNAESLFAETANLESIEFLYLSITNVHSFQKFLDESISKMTALKVLDIYMYYSGTYSGGKLTAKIQHLVNLEELYIDTVIIAEIEFVAKLPKLQKFEIFSISEKDFLAVKAKMQALGSKAEVLMSELPF